MECTQSTQWEVGTPPGPSLPPPVTPSAVPLPQGRRGADENVEPRAGRGVGHACGERVLSAGHDPATAADAGEDVHVRFQPPSTCVLLHARRCAFGRPSARARLGKENARRVMRRRSARSGLLSLSTALNVSFRRPALRLH